MTERQWSSDEEILRKRLASAERDRFDLLAERPAYCPHDGMPWDVHLNRGRRQQLGQVSDDRGEVRKSVGDRGKA